MKKILITGGLGFIGSNLIIYLMKLNKFNILNIDKYSYASNQPLLNRKYLTNLKLDISNYEELFKTINNFNPELIFHLAAESHVDRSIDASENFIKSNIYGTYTLLEAIKNSKIQTKLIHVSTDEVFGDLANSRKKFSEKTCYNPSSPYSASKASSDFLVKAWGRTYGIDYLITNCSNNFGPYQHIEKLIPTIINSIKNQKSIPVYGDGSQIRDWLYVEDHCEALYKLSQSNFKNESFNIGGNNTISNLKLIRKICQIADEEIYKKKHLKFKSQKLIKFVDDRPGHDIKYSINFNKIKKKIYWSPKHKFDNALRSTVNWYLDKL